jgi:hypothetical protein
MGSFPPGVQESGTFSLRWEGWETYSFGMPWGSSASITIQKIQDVQVPLERKSAQVKAEY